jgi:hypothetical protein
MFVKFTSVKLLIIDHTDVTILVKFSAYNSIVRGAVVR